MGEVVYLGLERMRRATRQDLCASCGKPLDTRGRCTFNLGLGIAWHAACAPDRGRK